MTLYFFRAETAPERAAINHFLRRHNQRGQGSLTGYVAYYAAAQPDPAPMCRGLGLLMKRSGRRQAPKIAPGWTSVY